MSRGPKRRAMVFVDYSGLRAALKQNPHLVGQSSPHATLDFTKLGQRLCSDDGEFIRLNLYSGEPVEVTETDEGLFMHSLKVHDHEAYRARLIMGAYQSLTGHVNSQAYVELNSGRMVLRRVEFKHGPAFQWVQNLLATIDRRSGDEDFDTIFSRAASINVEAKAARDNLSQLIVRLKDQGRIPASMMGGYSGRISQLMDESLDFTEKGVDTRLTVQLLEHCMNDSFDDAVLFAADEDYIPLVEAVKRTGRRVIHAFWDVKGSGYPLQCACDHSILLGPEDFQGLLFAP